MLGDNIKGLRIKKGLTQEELGKILNKTKNNISQYETGKREPDIETLVKLSDIFDVSISDIIGRKEEKNLVFANRFKELMKEKNISQAQLAEKLHIPEKIIAQYEEGVVPNNRLLGKITKFFDVTSDYLLGLIDDRTIDSNQLSKHMLYGIKIAKLIEKEGLLLTEESIPDIVDYAKYKLEQFKKKQDS